LTASPAVFNLTWTDLTEPRPMVPEPGDRYRLEAKAGETSGKARPRSRKAINSGLVSLVLIICLIIGYLYHIIIYSSS